MSLTLINYLSAPLILFTIGHILFKNSRSINSRIIFVFGLGAAGVALTVGLAFDQGNSGRFLQSLVWVRLANVFQILTFVALFRLSLSFPYNRPLPWLNGILLALFAVLAVISLATPWYVQSVILKNGFFFRVEGPFYRINTLIVGTLSLASLITFIARGLNFDNPVFRTQTFIIVFATVASTAFGLLVTVIHPSLTGDFSFYPLSAAGMLLFIICFDYVIANYHMFSVSAAVQRSMVFLIFSLLLLLPAGLAMWGLRMILGTNPALPLALGFAFLGLALLRPPMRRWTDHALRRRNDYRQELEDSLEAINFSRGRKEVLRNLLSAFSLTIGTVEMQIAVSGEGERMIPVYGNMDSTQLQRPSPATMQFLANTDREVLFRTEVASNPAFETIRLDLLSLYRATNSEVLILFCTGSELLGLITLGGKQNNDTYDIYDYGALTRVLPRLRMVLFYFRSFEHRQLVSIVARELERSDELIMRLKSHIDDPEPAGICLGQESRSISTLGGDFVDLVTLSDGRMIGVVGDMAGYGLNTNMGILILKSVFRTLARGNPDVPTLVQKINRFIKTQLPRECFFSGLLLESGTAQDEVHYVNCGLPLLYYYRQGDDSVKEVQGKGRILGFVEDVAPFVQTQTLSFHEGDCLLAVTGGLVDALSLEGVQYGKERVAQAFLGLQQPSCREAPNAVMQDCLEFVSQRVSDDMTVVCVQRIKRKAGEQGA